MAVDAGPAKFSDPVVVSAFFGANALSLVGWCGTVKRQDFLVQERIR